MFNNRVVYLHTIDDPHKPSLTFSKWYFVDDEQIAHNPTYNNITNSSWERINGILSIAEKHTHATGNKQVWIGFWFHGKVYLN